MLSPMVKLPVTTENYQASFKIKLPLILLITLVMCVLLWFINVLIANYIVL